MFGPGFWKGDLYTPQRNEQVVRNYARLATKLRHTVPFAKLGHDKQQRFALSLGFTNVGSVTRCDGVPGYPGYFEIDVDNVPTEVGGEINAGRLCGGSVELKSHERDPEDASKEVPGDVLTGISFLGEEQPAVRSFPPELRARSVPRATFADGAPVPANPSPARWLEAMADVTRQMAAEYRGEFVPERRAVRIKGREFSAKTVCFSDFDPNGPPPMTPEKEAALAAAGFTPEEIAAMKAALPAATTAAAGTPGAPAVPVTSPTMSAAPKPGEPTDFMSMCKKYADDPAATPEQKMMSAAFSKMFADNEENKKRIGELQASAEATQKKDADAQMAAFSAYYEPKLLALARKVEPVLIEKSIRPALADIAAAKTFASASDRFAAVDALLGRYLMQPDDPRLAPAPGPAVKQTPSSTENGRKVVNSLAEVAPNTHKRLIAAK